MISVSSGRVASTTWRATWHGHKARLMKQGVFAPVARHMSTGRRQVKPPNGRAPGAATAAAMPRCGPKELYRHQPQRLVDVEPRQGPNPVGLGLL